MPTSPAWHYIQTTVIVSDAPPEIWDTNFKGTWGEVLVSFGNQGWELVSLVPVEMLGPPGNIGQHRGRTTLVAVFKRPQDAGWD